MILNLIKPSFFRMFLPWCLSKLHCPHLSTGWITN